MTNSVFYALPLLSALIYALGSLCLKRSMELGSGAIRSIFMCNVLLGVCFGPLTFFSDQPLGLVDIYMPLILSVTVFFAQILVVLAIRLGGVTVQGPLMGIKIILVALLSVFLKAGTVDPAWWFAAILSALAIFLLGFSGLHHSKHVLSGALCAIGAASSFALADVLNQKWAPVWYYGPLNFMAVFMSGVSVLSLCLIPLFRWKLRDIPKPAWNWLLAGSTLMGVQELLFTVPIGLMGRATVVNILYSSRGIWSIALVWFVGHWFGSEERSVGGRVLTQRLVGALLLFAAILIVLLD